VFAVVVRIEQVLTHCPSAFFQPSHNPANANNSPSRTSKQNGCLIFVVRFHSKKPSAGIRHLRSFSGSRNAGFSAAVSDFALIVFVAKEGVFAQCGMRPHFISEICRTGSLGCWRITGTGWVGAMLYRGDQSS